MLPIQYCHLIILKLTISPIGSSHDHGDPSTLSRIKLITLKYNTVRDAGRDDRARIE